MKRYQKYKESGVEWLGKIPEHWEIVPAFVVFKEQCSRNKNLAEKNLLSLSYGKIVRKDFEANFGLLPESFETYQIVMPGNIILRLTDLQNDKKSLRVGLVKERGIITSAYLCLQPKNIYEKYVYTLLHNYDILKVFYNMGNGIRQNMAFKDLKRLPILVPTVEEQKHIARFLDRKLEQIDYFISNKQRLIELLKEQKTAIINRAVTKGLNPHAPMKPSGIDWLEEIPEHWGVKRAKYYFYEVDERSESGTEELLSVSHITGVTPRSEKNITMFQAESYEGYKTCQVGDLVSNIMWAWMGALGVSNYSGIVSSSYGVYRQKNHDNFVSRYLDYLVRTNSYISEFICRSKGIRSSRLRMYTDDFFDIPIIKPPKEDQEKILNYIDAERVKINLAIAKIEKEIELIQEYRTTLISDAVTGKIDIRDTSIIETTLTTTAN
jgi:type I restriction enzyme S subunit